MAAKIEFIPYKKGRWSPEEFVLETGRKGDFWRIPDLYKNASETPILVDASLSDLTIVRHVKPGEGKYTVVELAASSLTLIVHRAAIRKERDFLRGTMRISHINPDEPGSEVLADDVPRAPSPAELLSEEIGSSLTEVHTSNNSFLDERLARQTVEAIGALEGTGDRTEIID
ncbi:MAG: hypothetical protein H6799_03230 [Candidatus Nomurabacteria bacterium]|nr:MAG: hypothetical protein H6799_03230 [Candidatus Nomurabacteria bacterium]